jgi:hypothetical protein
MYTNDQMMSPMPQQTQPVMQGQQPPMQGQMSAQDIQKMKLMQAMQAINSNQQGATTSEGATANALAQALNGYVQGMNMQKTGGK